MGAVPARARDLGHIQVVETRQAGWDLTPEQAPRWAHPIPTDRELVGEVMVWRAVTGFTKTNDGGSVVGVRHRPSRPAATKTV